MGSGAETALAGSGPVVIESGPTVVTGVTGETGRGLCRTRVVSVVSLRKFYTSVHCREKTDWGTPRGVVRSHSRVQEDTEDLKEVEWREIKEVGVTGEDEGPVSTTGWGSGSMDDERDDFYDKGI